jgi:hypothetical protein
VNISANPSTGWYRIVKGFEDEITIVGDKIKSLKVSEQWWCS